MDVKISKDNVQHISKRIGTTFESHFHQVAFVETSVRTVNITESQKEDPKVQTFLRLVHLVESICTTFDSQDLSFSQFVQL